MAGNEKPARKKKTKGATGEGTVYQRKDGRWEAAVWVHTGDGTRKRVSAYGATRDEAVAARAELVSKDRQGVPAASSDRLGDYLTYWLAEVAKPQLRPRTFETYTRCVNKHIVPMLGSKRLRTLTPSDVQQLLNAKQRSGLAPRTVAYIRAVLRSALTHAMREGRVQRNVAGLARPPRAPKRRASALTADEARTLLTTAKGDRLHALWVIALTLGLRRAELLGLTWKAIDLDGGMLVVSQGVQRIGGQLVLDEVKSERSHRVLPLPKVAREALRAHRTRQAKDVLKAGKHWIYNDLVFCTAYGAPIDPRNLNRAFRSLLIRANVGVEVEEHEDGKKTYRTTVRLHDLRHSCASLLLTLGASPRVVMEILGHSGISITMDTYTHVMPTLLGDAITGMDELFG